MGHAKTGKELVKEYGGEFLVVGATALVFYALLGFATSFWGTSPLLILVGGAVAIASIIPISIFAAVVTHSRGLNPDNFVNPVTSSIADTLMTLSLWLAASLLL